jgi:hypothetical protein
MGEWRYLCHDWNPGSSRALLQSSRPNILMWEHTGGSYSRCCYVSSLDS